jgi:hypothetical protein
LSPALNALLTPNENGQVIGRRYNLSVSDRGKTMVEARRMRPLARLLAPLALLMAVMAAGAGSRPAAAASMPAAAVRTAGSLDAASQPLLQKAYYYRRGYYRRPYYRRPAYGYRRPYYRPYGRPRVVCTVRRTYYGPRRVCYRRY